MAEELGGAAGESIKRVTKRGTEKLENASRHRRGRSNARAGTRTRSFGSSKREGHDATPFYNSRMYRELDVAEGAGRVTAAGADADPATSGERVTPRPYVPDAPLDRRLEPGDVNDPFDQIYCADSRHMSAVPDDSVHLMVTSPPYNVGKEYDEDLSLDEYRALLRDVFAETFRKLVDGGRACVNVANVGRKPYIPLHAWIIEEMLGIGYRMRGEIIWDKAASSGGSCAWGSWQSAANPTLRDVHEYILVFSKGSYGRSAKERENTITRDQFLEYTKSIWSFPTQRAGQVGHPAPFPVELPRRLIELYTFKDDVVLDPFCGSGSTCVAAVETGRRFIGYDVEPKYIQRALERVDDARQEAAHARAQAQLP